MDYIRQPPSPEVLRAAFAAFPQGVAAIAAEVGGKPEVLLASTFTVGVSLEPPLTLFAVQKRSGTWPLLRRAEWLGVSVLSAHQHIFARQLAGHDRASRLTDIATHVSSTGAVFVQDAAIWLECTVDGEVIAGDHDIVILKIDGLYSVPEPDPLVFHGSRFRRIAAEPIETPADSGA